MATVTINVPDENVAEVRAAIGHALGKGSAASGPESVQWIRRQVRDAVLRYREAQQADIDRTDPTSD